jgi:hypothetical protein
VDPALETARLVTSTYRDVGGLAFAYGQGSLVAGFSRDSDLDIAMVWDGDEPPSGGRRAAAVRKLHDGGHSRAAQFDHHEYVRDKFWMGSQQVDVHHYTMKVFDRWLTDVYEGRGWEDIGDTMSLYSIAGFAYGKTIGDYNGGAAAAQEEIEEFPQALVERSRMLLLAELPSYDEDLAACVQRGDGWGFHELLNKVLRHVLVAWFAAEQRYCPHPKWIHRWITRFGMDTSLANVERAMWGPVSLGRRRELFLTLANRVLELPVGGAERESDGAAAHDIAS